MRAQPASEGASTCQDARLKALKNRGAERRVWLVGRLVSFTFLILYLFVFLMLHYFTERPKLYLFVLLCLLLSLC